MRRRWWWPSKTAADVATAHAQLAEAQTSAATARRQKEDVRQLFGPNGITTRVAHAIRGDDEPR